MRNGLESEVAYLCCYESCKTGMTYVNPGFFRGLLELEFQLLQWLHMRVLCTNVLNYKTKSQIGKAFTLSDVCSMVLLNNGVFEAYYITLPV